MPETVTGRWFISGYCQIPTVSLSFPFNLAIIARFICFQIKSIKRIFPELVLLPPHPPPPRQSFSFIFDLLFHFLPLSPFLESLEHIIPFAFVQTFRGSSGLEPCSSALWLAVNRSKSLYVAREQTIGFHPLALRFCARARGGSLLLSDAGD